eukprot:scpid41873/ scgid25428/ Exportin-2; Cellular apoptosis susceptibility protein; Chromosome segregation 1-like protein; Importin-alpha re-exporter
MEVTDGNLDTLAVCLTQTVSADPAVRKPAEKFLEGVECQQNYGILLLKLFTRQSSDDIVKLAAAVTFKNFVKRNWPVKEDETDRISAADRSAIKLNIVSLMLSMPAKLQKQLSDAISIIGKSDFPRHWPELLPELVRNMEQSSTDFDKINGILQTAHSLFKRYRHEFRTDELFSEIKYAIQEMAKPLTILFKNTIALAGEHANNAAALQVLFGSLALISKIFYSLNYQDLPEFFEDNMSIWMDNFHQLLTTNNKLLESDSEDEAGPLERLKSQICDNVALYAHKYDEEFQPHLPKFVEATWNLLVNQTTLQVKHDLLVCNAIQFLASVAAHDKYKTLFEAEGTLTTICQNVVVPNMQFRDVDEEQFEDNPEEYIRRDIEGSDVDTRRRAACDLVLSLTKVFEGPVTAIFKAYVASLLQEYNTDNKNWRCMDTAIYLISALASKASTEKHGATKINQLVDLNDFFSNTIAALLQAEDVNDKPVLKASAIKFLVTFRQHLPRNVLLAAFLPLSAHLASTHTVVHTYAAHGVERLLMLQNPSGGAPFTGADLEPVLKPLLAHMFSALSQPGSQESDYVMKALMRTLSAARDHILPYVPSLLEQLKAKVIMVAKNPSKPNFNHYLFECISCMIRFTCQKDVAAIGHFESELFPIFQIILQNDVLEFLPYVFQILSLTLEIHPAPIPDAYMDLFPLLLVPALWERQGNITPLVRLLKAYVCKAGSHIISLGKMEPLLGVWQKLIASKTNDHEGFSLLQAIVEYIPQDTLEPFLGTLFTLIFQRLTSAKTVKFVKGLIVFFSLYAGKFGGSALIKRIEPLQTGLFNMVLEKLFLSDLQKVSGPLDRKTCAVGVTNLLTATPEVLSGTYACWPNALVALVRLFELPEEEDGDADEHFAEIEDQSGYQTVYAGLIFAGRVRHDPFPEVADVKVAFVKSLQTMLAQHAQFVKIIQA